MGATGSTRVFFTQIFVRWPYFKASTKLVFLPAINIRTSRVESLNFCEPHM